MNKLISLLNFRLFGVDAFCSEKKFLVYNLFRRNMIVKYRRSYFGLFWTLLGPLGTCLVFYFVFQKILSVPIPHYIPFIITGLFPWAAFSQSVSEGTESIVANTNLVSKIPIPVNVFPFVASITAFSNLIFSIPIIIASVLLSGLPLYKTWLLVPVYFVFFFLITYSLTWILAFSFVYLRDLKHALTIILQIGFYGTPIFYNLDMIPEQYRFFLYFNPVAPIFIGLRNAILNNSYLPEDYFIQMVAWTVALFMFALILHRRMHRKVTEVL